MEKHWRTVRPECDFVEIIILAAFIENNRIKNTLLYVKLNEEFYETCENFQS